MKEIFLQNMFWLKIGLTIAINYSRNVSPVISIESTLVLLALMDRRRRELHVSPDKLTTTSASRNVCCSSSPHSMGSLKQIL